MQSLSGELKSFVCEHKDCKSWEWMPITFFFHYQFCICMQKFCDEWSKFERVHSFSSECKSFASEQNLVFRSECKICQHNEMVMYKKKIVLNVFKSFLGTQKQVVCSKHHYVILCKMTTIKGIVQAKNDNLVIISSLWWHSKRYEFFVYGTQKHFRNLSAVFVHTVIVNGVQNLKY